MTQALYRIKELYGAMGGLYNLLSGNADVAHMGREALFIGHSKRHIGTLQDAQVGKGSFVGIEVVFGTKVVDATRQKQGMGNMTHDLTHPGDASILPCGKAQRSTLKDSLLDIDHKIAVGMHTGMWSIVHPGGTQGYTLGTQLQCTLLGYQFVAAIVVLRSYGNGLIQQSHLKITIIHLVGREEDEFASILGRSTSEILYTGNIHEVALIGMLLAIARVGQSCQMHDGMRAMKLDVLTYSLKRCDVKFTM